MTKDSKFIFSGHKWLPQERKAEFNYQIQHDNETFDFTEVLSFPRNQLISDVPSELLKNLLDSLLLALGISYYKLFCPKEISLEGIFLSKEQADFWNTVYTKGLGEFFYKNDIDFRGLINFPFSDSAKPNPVSFPRKDRSLVGIGGGKDSIVSAELLKGQDKRFSSFMLNSYPLQEEVVRVIGGDCLVVKRQLDTKLFELNKRTDVYNGHIPVSAIYAFVGLFLAVLYDFRFVVVSNEQSASYGNVNYQGMEINHQWSKSLEFESKFADYAREFISPDVIYFSLLRQMTEIAVVKKFVEHPKYFPHFSSCNRNFKITGEGQAKKWCGECAKCAFAFVCLTAFLPKDEVVKIFGQNLFRKAELLRIYKELLGVEAFKPFDCVGTPEEVKVAFYLTLQKNEYNEDVVMRFFKDEVLQKIGDIETLTVTVFESSKEHRIPDEFWEVLNHES